MKKLLLFLCFLIILPISVLAEDNSKNVIIKSIELIDKSDNAEELEEASFNNLDVVLNIKLYDINDYVKYKLVVNNNSSDDLEINNDISSNNEYIDYKIEVEDSDVVKKGKESILYLTVTYKNEAPKEAYRSAKIESNTSVTLKLFSEDLSVPDTLKNMSKTIFVVLIIIMVLGILFYRRNNKFVKLSILLLIGIISIPNIKAALLFNININSNVVISKVKENLCMFDGELVQGSEYVNGQYTYRYMQENGSSDWTNITTDGWGVRLTNPTSTEDITTKLCSKINDKPVVSMSYMFNNSQTKNIDLSSFDTSNVINMVGMFYGVNKVEELDLSSFDTSNVINLNMMFHNMTNIKSLDLRYFDTSSVLELNALFYNDNNLLEVNMDNFDFSNLSNSGGGHFYNTTSLKKISARNWIIPESFIHWVSRNWAGNNSPIEEIDVTGWDLSRTKDIQGLFADSRSLKTIIGLDTWDTSNITNMSQLFYNCNNISELDLGSFDLSKIVTNGLNQIITNTTKLAKIKTPKINSSSETIQLSETYSDENNNFYTSITSSTENQIWIEAITMFYPGQQFNNLVSNKSNVISFKRTNVEPSDLSQTTIVSLENSTYPIYLWEDNGSLFVYSQANVIYLHPNSSYMFSNFTNASSIDLNGISSFFVNDMSYMFNYCTNIESLDLSMFNTSNVTRFSYMFYKMNNLRDLNLSNFDFSNYNNGYGLTGELFGGDNESLKNLNVSNAKFGKYMVFTFYYTRNVETINLTGVDTSLVEDMNQAFYQLTKLKEINLSDFDTENVTDMSNLFNGCSSLKKINLNGLDIRKVQTFKGMISNCSSLEELELSNLDFSNYEKAAFLFNMDNGYCNRTIKKLNLENSIFSPDSQDMFCGSYEEINLKNVNTSHVTKMDYMFYDIPNVRSLDFSSFDTSNVKSMYYMFKYSNMIENLDLSYFDLSSIDPLGNGVYGMLLGINNAKRIDLSGLDLSYVLIDNRSLGLHINDNYLEELVTPKNLNIGDFNDISISKRMYAKGDTVGITSITKDTPTSTIYKDHVWN